MYFKRIKATRPRVRAQEPARAQRCRALPSAAPPGARPRQRRAPRPLGRRRRRGNAGGAGPGRAVVPPSPAAARPGPAAQVPLKAAVELQVHAVRLRAERGGGEGGAAGRPRQAVRESGGGRGEVESCHHGYSGTPRCRTIQQNYAWNSTINRDVHKNNHYRASSSVQKEELRLKQNKESKICVCICITKTKELITNTMQEISGKG
ncbi:uncharacterized protein [Ciconia boyciana]|uniref:uncharacterized protein n=1 Tax=Ciconia boyciana TaxID=52775 RepID=UPI003BA1435B